jgi:L-asparaginase/Glu-tRNA(Gln) amidotransferase subunit D
MRIKGDSPRVYHPGRSIFVFSLGGTISMKPLPDVEELLKRKNDINEYLTKLEGEHIAGVCLEEDYRDLKDNYTDKLAELDREIKSIRSKKQEFYSPQELLDRVPGYHGIADVTSVETLTEIDSADIGISEMASYCERFYDAYEKGADGIVVYSGTDRLPWIASATTFMLPELKKPLIFIASMSRPDENPHEVRKIIENGLRVSTADIGGVYVAIENQLLKGCRIEKTQTQYRRNPFESPHYPVGRIGNDYIEFRNGKSQSRLNINYDSASLPILDTAMHKIHLYSVDTAYADEPERLRREVKNCRADKKFPRGATLIQTHASGNIPSRLVPEIEKLMEEDGHIFVLASKNPSDTVRPEYDGTRVVVAAGAIPAYDMVFNCARAKTEWIMPHILGLEGKNRLKRSFITRPSRKKEYFEDIREQFREIFFRNYADEITVLPEIVKYNSATQETQTSTSFQQSS